MINQICSQCSELTGPSDRCECCGGDPAAAEVPCGECQGTRRVVRYANRYRMHTYWTECDTCLHSGRPGYVEAPHILEHDAHAKRAYWMDCPLSEIPLRAPFKELREVEPSTFEALRKRHPDCPPCASCGYPVCKSFYWVEAICTACTMTFSMGKLPERMMKLRAELWTDDPLVPAGLSAGGGA